MVLIENVIKKKTVRSWEEYISQGLEIREVKDNTEWMLGDLAGEVQTDYGKDSIGKFSYAIGLARKTIMGYRTLAQRYPPEVRKKYRKLSFSHFKTCAALPLPEAWLEKADDNNWSVETMTEKIKDEYGTILGKMPEDRPPRVYKCPECGLWRLEDTSYIDICKGHYEITEGRFGYK